MLQNVWVTGLSQLTFPMVNGGGGSLSVCEGVSASGPLSQLGLSHFLSLSLNWCINTVGSAGGWGRDLRAQLLLSSVLSSYFCFFAFFRAVRAVVRLRNHKVIFSTSSLALHICLHVNNNPHVWLEYSWNEFLTLQPWYVNSIGSCFRVVGLNSSGI